jgi:Fic family protein
VQRQFEGVEPSRPEFIIDKLDNLSAWLDSDGVNSMSTPEKATLAFVRLLEIAPFERGNFRLAHLLLSYFAYRDQFPPLFLRADDIADIRREIAGALAFETKPLVDRLTDAQLASIEYCLKAVA